jgi:hypothetical protein
VTASKLGQPPVATRVTSAHSLSASNAGRSPHAPRRAQWVLRSATGGGEGGGGDGGGGGGGGGGGDDGEDESESDDTLLDWDGVRLTRASRHTALSAETYELLFTGLIQSLTDPGPHSPPPIEWSSSPSQHIKQELTPD